MHSTVSQSIQQHRFTPDQHTAKQAYFAVQTTIIIYCLCSPLTESWGKQKNEEREFQFFNCFQDIWWLRSMYLLVFFKKMPAVALQARFTQDQGHGWVLLDPPAYLDIIISISLCWPNSALLLKLQGNFM